MVAFALQLAHPAHGLRRVEFVTPKTLALLTDGSISLNRVGGRTSSPETLYFQWWLPRETGVQFHISPARRGPNATPAEIPRLNGAEVSQGTLEDGDLVQWREFQIVVLGIKALREPELAMVEAAKADDVAVQVYADWLETKGATQSAEWARLAVSALGATDKARMNELAPRLGGSFRALVSRGPIERCLQSCGQRWESLALVNAPCRRSCSQCGQTVSWCEDAASARTIPGPVVLDPATPREAGDLLPRPVMVG